MAVSHEGALYPEVNGARSSFDVTLCQYLLQQVCGADGLSLRCGTSVVRKDHATYGLRRCTLPFMLR